MTHPPIDPKLHLPDFSRPVDHESIVAGAEVVRDQWGVPHIRSSNLYDLFFAQGYATAQDRLWQMDYDRKRALGRAGEYLGESARTQDTLMRRRDMESVSKRDYEICSPDAKTTLDAYADGVNAFIAGPDPLPLEYELLDSEPDPWEAWHCIAVYKVRNTAEGGFQSKLWTAMLAQRIGVERVATLKPGYLPGMYLTVPPGREYDGGPQRAIDELTHVVNACEPLREIDSGSNGWAISGDLTESGLPMVGGDSHRGLEVPNVYYQTHLTHPDFDVLGHSVPGMPLVMHFAHNRYVAWGMTHGGCDTQDLFVEKLRRVEGGGVEYLFKGEWLEAEVRTEQLEFAQSDGLPDTDGTVTVEVVRTHHGPIISGDAESGWGVALADPGSEDGTVWVDAALAAMAAKSADEFETALAGWTDRVNNYPYADIHGEFGYCLKGRVPVRPYANAWGPVPGWTGDHEWEGYIPADQMPRARNPETGWVVTCNQRVVGDDYPYWLSASFGPDYRARRIISHIEGHRERDDKVGIDQMREFHKDAYSIPAIQFKSRLSNMRLPGDAAPAVVEGVRLLSEWDGEMGYHRGATVWSWTHDEMLWAMMPVVYGSDEDEQSVPIEAFDHFRRNVKPWFFAELAAGRDCSRWLGSLKVEELILQSIECAMSLVAAHASDDQRPPTDPPEWGRIHRTSAKHPLTQRFGDAPYLSAPQVPSAGDGDVPCATGRALRSNDIVSGPVNRYLHDPSDWSNGKWVVPRGVSGNSASPHYSDQQPLWSEVTYIPQLFEWDDIVRESESAQSFKPSG